MGDHLKGRVAIVTGSGHGIGKCIALALAKEGAKVVTNSRRAEMCKAAAEEIIGAGGEALSFPCDVSSFKETERLIGMALDGFGGLDILVNNAGNVAPRMIWRMTEQEWDSVISIHLKGTFNCVHHASKYMKEKQYGRIVNTISGGWLGVAGNANYAAAKGGIVGLTKTVAEEMSRFGVTCNCYGPIADTDDGKGLLDKETFVAHHRKRFEAGFESEREFKQLTNAPGPETVPPLVVYLCTEQAANITARIFMVCGNDISITSIKTDARVINKEGSPWTLEELHEHVPSVLLS
ncbi:MAG: SDR family NAD(P)-dependent oxidoreductase [Deltaproteobacteria bacterium]|nr:SDR family NAD(P)-dependent oxidoreductase [Deltaproteobacteria bacterium]